MWWGCGPKGGPCASVEMIGRNFGGIPPFPIRSAQGQDGAPGVSVGMIRRVYLSIKGIDSFTDRIDKRHTLYIQI